MSYGFYNQLEDWGGFVYDGCHVHFGYPNSGYYDTNYVNIAGGSGFIQAIACPPEATDTLYVFTGPLHSSIEMLLMVSHDRGQTWTQLPMPPGIRASGNWAPWTIQFVARSATELYFVNDPDTSTTDLSARQDGVYRSLDGGTTWTHIVTFTGTSGSGASTVPYGGLGGMDLGASGLWYAEGTSRAAASTSWALRRSNFDGSGISTLWTTTFATGNTGALPLRAWGDAFVLIPSWSQSHLWKLDASGTLHDITPSAGTIFDAVPLSATTFIALVDTGQVPNPYGGSGTVGSASIQRTTDAGVTWTEVRHLVGVDSPTDLGVASEFGYHNVISPSQSSFIEVYVQGGLGNKGPAPIGVNLNETAPLVTWHSTDSGATFSAIHDETMPVGNDGYYLFFGPGGLVAGPPVTIRPCVPVAVPSRLATIVG